MDLRFSAEENAFRQELRTLLPRRGAGVHPQEGDARTATSARRRWSPRTRSCTPRASPCRTGPRSGAAPIGRPVQHYIYTEELQFNGVPQPLPFNVSHVRAGGHRLRHAGAEEALPAAHGGARRLVVPGLLGARRRLRPRRPQDHGRAPGRPLRRQRPEDLDHAGAVRRLDLLPVPHRPGRQEAARHLLPPDRHEDAGHHRAPDPDHRRRPRGQRGVLRRRQGAGREPGRPGAPRLGLRQVPARQRAHRHRPRRLLQAARAAHQGAGRARSWPATGR